ncbi:phosphotransferase [Brevibacillus migulae]|uniref:phosphotransferase n=1 Tax=Brevibacillus migulae TaxID=1644114 RepID=UPI00106E88FB|nr:phosphotransferase [Brevibacillus migulae]
MLEPLLRQIHLEYGLKIQSYEVIRDTPKTMVIHLKTDRGSFFAKTMYIQEDRQHFILSAEAHLRDCGIFIPPLVQTLKNAPFIECSGNLFYLQKDVRGNPYSLKSPNQMRRIGELLGQLHASSVGLLSSSGERYNGALRWEHEYETDLRSLQRWYEQFADSAKPKIKLLRQHLPYFLHVGQEMHQLLGESSFFQEWKERPEHLHPLCHGDFHMGNVIKSENRLYVIDWEDVRYDYPSKDLSRLLYTYMRRYNGWNREKCEMLFRAYFKKNPMKKREKALLYQDLAFPHIFEWFLRRKQYTTMSYQRVSLFLKSERSKTDYMRKQAKARVIR